MGCKERQFVKPTADAIDVLYVDDDPGFADLVAASLDEDERLSVRTATHPDDGLQLLSAHDIDCVVSDYDMPRTNGIEFLEAVRERSPEFPFILYTGEGSEEIASEAISSGVSDYLQKKSGTEQYELLSDRIKNSVTQFRAQRELRTQREELEQLHETTRDLLRAENRQKVAEIATRAAQDILGLSINSVYFYDADERTLSPTAFTPDAERLFGDLPTFIPENEVAWEVFETGEPRTYNNIRADPNRYDPDTEIRSELIYPLGEHGVLFFASTTTGAFDDLQTSLAEVLADNVEVALDHAQHERELQRKNRRYQATFDDPNILVGLIDTDGNVLDINETAMNYVGVSYDAVTGVPFWETPWFDHSRTARNEIREWIDRAASGEYVEFEADRIDPDGERYTVEGALRPVTDSDGEVVSLLISSRDITDRKVRERRLEALNHASRELITATTEQEVAEMGIGVAEEILDLEANAIHIYDEASSELRPVAVTDTARDLVGDPPTFTPGDSIAWRVYERNEALALDDVREDPDIHDPDTAIHSELYLPIDEHGILIAGSPTRAAFDQQDVLLGGVLAGNIATALEQVRRTEELRARERELTRQNDRLEEFASVVSHDLRNPLNVAEGRLELAHRECDCEHLAHIERAHERMGILIEDVLRLAREGKAVTDVDPVDLTTVAEGCWKNVETADATLVVDTDRTIEADENRLKQLLENLVRNAIEHGGEDVTVTVGPLADGFYIEDTGPGISENDRENVFEAGYSTDEEGTGFGLSIAKRIVDAHDWEISVTEGTDGGARFEITDAELVTD